MDSGNEVIIVDEKVATTNGFNGGSYEEVIVVAPPLTEMKTRSRGTENASTPASASATTTTAAASRSTRAAAAQNDKTGDNDRKEVKKTGDNDRKEVKKTGDNDRKEVKKTGDNDRKEAKKSGDNDKKEAKKTGDNDRKEVKKTGDNDRKEVKKSSGDADYRRDAENTPLKRKAAGGEDDSGINSRSSSVSNEETTYSSRMRTRSKTAASSTPASTKKGASRMPLSTYDFDEEISMLEEDPSTSGSLKRKAVLYVEEMEEPAEPVEQPPAKRVALQSAGLGLVNALLSPFRAIRSRVSSSVASQTEVPKSVENVNGTDDAAVQTHVTNVNDDDPEKENVASQTDLNASNQAADTVDKASSSTCRLM